MFSNLDNEIRPDLIIIFIQEKVSLEREFSQDWCLFAHPTRSGDLL
jgi:hypothetical protein